MYRQDRASFDAIVRKQVQGSKANIPSSVGNMMDSAYKVVPRQEVSPDNDFWSDEEGSSFGHLTDDDD